MAGSKGP
jgi:hypothetical protein